MNVKQLCAHITNFGFDLVGAELALDVKYHIAKEMAGNRTSLIWVSDQDAPLLIGNPSTLDCYRSLIEAKDYSYLMNDGGVIQIALTYDGRRIEAHRFLYHPCPFPVTKAAVDEFGKSGSGLLDFIDGNFMDNVKDNLLLRSPIRFDYAPDAATESHPASHLTLNDPECRVPVHSPLQFGTFMEFVLRNFYMDAWRHPTCSKLRQLRHEDDVCLSADDRRRVHLNWEAAKSRRRPHRRAPAAASRRRGARSRRKPSA